MVTGRCLAWFTTQSLRLRKETPSLIEVLLGGRGGDYRLIQTQFTYLSAKWNIIPWFAGETTLSPEKNFNNRQEVPWVHRKRLRLGQSRWWL